MNICLGPELIIWYDLSDEKKDMIFGRWKVRSLYSAGSLATAARVLRGSSGSGMWGVWTGSNWLRIGTGGGHL
jgi:hypothetical protein